MKIPYCTLIGKATLFILGAMSTAIILFGLMHLLAVKYTVLYILASFLESGTTFAHQKHLNGYFF